MIDRASRLRLFIKEELYIGLDIDLSVEQAKYLFKVMRLNVGQTINIIDGNTGEYRAKITIKGTRSGKLLVKEKISELIKPPNLWLLFSPLRKNRTEWVVEKATELGVRRMIPVITARTVNVNVRIQRLKMIMIEALEQCGGTFLPTLAEPISIVDCLNFWPSDRTLNFCDESLSAKTDVNNFFKRQRNKESAILIGPEGGFTETEVQLIKQKKNVVSVSLGPRILRADTAAVAAISIWQNVDKISE